uniref:Uncharacterized protein n=1 Tax=Arundo donax TaxID=35708 RepID=A0A0A9H945_ARUDO
MARSDGACCGPADRRRLEDLDTSCRQDLGAAVGGARSCGGILEALDSGHLTTSCVSSWWRAAGCGVVTESS